MCFAVRQFQGCLIIYNLKTDFLRTCYLRKVTDSIILSLMLTDFVSILMESQAHFISVAELEIGPTRAG